jgi:hypothetical protein
MRQQGADCTVKVRSKKLLQLVFFHVTVVSNVVNAE